MARRRHYLIDGYNIAHALARGPLAPDQLEASRTSLARLLRPLIDRRTAVTLVFDSRQLPEAHLRRPPLGGVPGTLQVHYAADADAAIIEMVRRAPKGTESIVVSRDKEVCGRTQQLGARILRIEELLEKLGSAADDLPDPGEPPEKYGVD